MRAVRFEMSVPRYLFSAAASKLSPALCVGGLSCVQFRSDAPDPRPLGDDWVVLRPRLSGICGSDLGIIFAKDSPSLEPFASGPFTFGHENLADVVEAGPAARDLKVGDRVVVDPTLGCVQRGIDPPCPACREGLGGVCHNQTRGKVGAGHLGFNRDTGGGWSEGFTAHASMVHRVPDGIEDEEAVLVDPFCSGLHPVLAAPPPEGARVLVLGCGVIGLGLIAALRALGYPNRILAVARHPHQQRMATEMGADEIISRSDTLYERIAELTGASLHRPTLGAPVLLGGPEVIYDCVGSARTIDDALRVIAPRGTLVVVGTAPRMKVDWSFVWFKEVRVQGVMMAGAHDFEGRRQPTYAIALALLERRRARLRPLLSRVYPLASYREAIAAARAKASSEVIKVAMRP